MAEYIFGRRVLTEPCELLDPRWTALVLVDVQNYDCSPVGPTAQKGKAGANLAMVEHLKILADEARECSVPLVYLRNSFLPDGRLNSPADLSRRRWLWGENCLPTIVGTWEHEIAEPVQPHPGDLVISKTRQSGFFGTPLDGVLRADGIQSLIITGTATQGCVESTVRDALAHDYYVVVPEDCVSSTNPELHACSLKVMRGLAHLVTDSSKIITSWKSSRAL